MKPENRIFVAGHRGLVGGAIVRRLRASGFENLVLATRQQLDLTEQAAVRRFFEEQKPDYVFLAAAKVGGILANDSHPADFLRDNLAIELNVIDAAWRSGVRKLLFLGSSCIYPKFAPQPITEDALLTGPLEPTNDAYAVAKIAGIKLAQSYRRQYGFNAISLMPTNLYGPGDNFDLQTSHVLPALLRKFHEARESGATEVTVWGSGSPRREFLHVDDLAEASVFLMNNYDDPEIVNVGTGEDITIADLARMIAAITGFTGRIVFDSSKPDGTPRKLLDVSRLTQIGWHAHIPLEEGIREVYGWYLGVAGGGGPMKSALITGITGQDGSFLAELLLRRGYTVHGIVRRASTFNTGRLEHLYADPHEGHPKIALHYGDITDGTGLRRVLEAVQPDEVYNLAAQSHVRVSFDQAEYTADVVATGTVRLFEAVRDHQQSASRLVRVYQAGSSEMFGGAPPPQSEGTPFQPRSPYAVSKVAGHFYAVNYREAYGMYISNGILFNHESERRGETFVTRKITRALARIKQGLQKKLYLGNLDARRDWGYADDYVEAMWMMLQQPEPGDFVIATGEAHSVRDFLDAAAAVVDLDWKPHVELDPRYLRPTEVNALCGDSSKARKQLGWAPKVSFAEMVSRMMEHDLELARQEQTLLNAGHRATANTGSRS